MDSRPVRCTSSPWTIPSRGPQGPIWRSLLIRAGAACSGWRRIAYLIPASLAVLVIPGQVGAVTFQRGAQYDGVFFRGPSQTIASRDNGTVAPRLRPRSVRSLEFNSAEGTAAAPQYDPPARAAAQLEPKLIPSGAEIKVRTNETIDSKTAAEGQKFSGVIDRDVLDSRGVASIPKGSNAELVIRKVSGGGTLSSPDLVLDIDAITVGGERYVVSTANLEKKSAEGIGKNKRTAEMIGGGAGLGALLGAIAGHGKGAAIGAVVGAAAGGTAQVITKGKEVKVPAEAVLTFHLDQDLRLEPVRSASGT